MIAGKAKGIPLKAPKTNHTRPTLDRTKETVFNILQSKIVGAKVLDLFAGTGALGIEALSRGARHAVFIDKQRDCTALIEENLNKTALGENATVFCGCFRKWIPQLYAMNEMFDIVFLDPPYNQGYIDEAIAQICKYKLFNKDTILMVEKNLNEAMDMTNLALEKEKKFGQTTFLFLRINNFYEI